MTLRASRYAWLLVLSALAWVGLTLTAQAAHATYSKVTIVKTNVGGPATDTFAFHPAFVPAKADFSIRGGESNTTQVECNVGSSCSKWGYPAESVTELAKDDYDLTAISCHHEQGYDRWPSEPSKSSVKDTDTMVTGSKIDLKLKMWEWVKCYVTNTYVQPTGRISVTKKVDSIAGEAGRFDLSAAGPDTVSVDDVGDGGTTGSRVVRTGDYTVGETGAPGTDLGDYDAAISCVDSAYGHDHTPVNGASVHVSKGDAWACTITNTRKVAYLEVQKDIVPATDDGRFDLHGDGPSHIEALGAGDGGSTNERKVLPGSYTVSEDAAPGTDLAGYASTVECERKVPAAPKMEKDVAGTSLAGVVVKAGEKWQCTITNTRKATIEVHKHLVGAPNSPADTGRFDLLIDQGVGAHDVGDGGSTGDVSLLPGAHVVGETAGTGTSIDDYTSSVQCERTLPADPPMVTGADGATLADLAVAPGERWQCAITNVRRTATLEIDKHVVPAPGRQADAGLFDLHGDGPSTIDALGIGDGGGTGPQQVLPGGYTIGEAAGAATSLADYAASIHCRRTSPEQGGGQDADGTSLGGLQIAAGESWRCTITNARKPAGIAVVKTGPATAQAGSVVPYALEVTDTGQTSFAEPLVEVTDDMCDGPPALQAKNGDATPDTLDPGDRWTYTCSVTTTVDRTSVVNTGHVKGTDQGGQVVTDQSTATTTLTQPPRPTPPPKPTPPATTPVQPPRRQVGPVRVTSGSAKLRGRRGCARSTAAATVTGRRIVKVTFFVDGHEVRTLTRANRSGGRWVLALDLRRMAFGTHRVRASVRFAASSQTGSRSLRTTVTRCRPAVLTPKFTG